MVTRFSLLAIKMGLSIALVGFATSFVAPIIDGMIVELKKT